MLATVVAFNQSLLFCIANHEEDIVSSVFN